jgi:plasminogen activator inhibitor 1 RNA-binding protein
LQNLFDLLGSFTQPRIFGTKKIERGNRNWRCGRIRKQKTDATSILGNDVEGDESPAAPVKTVEKTSTHTAKRNTDGSAPVKAAPTSSRRGGAPGGNEGGM